MHSEEPIYRLSFLNANLRKTKSSISLHLAIEIQESLLYLSTNCLLSAKDNRIVCQWLLRSVTGDSLADLRTTLPNAISLSPDLFRPAALGRMIRRRYCRCQTATLVVFWMAACFITNGDIYQCGFSLSKAGQTCG